MLSKFRTLPLTTWVSGSQNKNSSGTRSGTELLFLGLFKVGKRCHFPVTGFLSGSLDDALKTRIIE